MVRTLHALRSAVASLQDAAPRLDMLIGEATRTGRHKMSHKFQGDTFRQTSMSPDSFSLKDMRATFNFPTHFRNVASEFI